MQERIQDYILYFNDVWEQSPSHLPQFERTYSRSEKQQRENGFNAFQQKLKKLNGPIRLRKTVDDPTHLLFPLLKNFMAEVFDFNKENLNVMFSDAFMEATKRFYHRARAFGSELSSENIFQALRNVWIMNQLQLVTHFSVHITPSVFAYSMIYPYSDNFLDNPDYSHEEKQLFSLRLNQRLHGESVLPFSHEEKRIYTLVEMMEEEFPRHEYAGVYASLYAIHKGQTQSLKLMRSVGLNDLQIQSICFEKGGASVLADGYLVAGKLTQQKERALFAYGIYLQLLDDIQDLDEDKLANTKTMFSLLSKDELALAVNKTIHFGRKVLEEMSCFYDEANPAIIALISQSIDKMIIESVGVLGHRYNGAYLAELEHYSPLRFSFIRNKNAQSQSQRFAILQQVLDLQAKRSAAIIG